MSESVLGGYPVGFSVDRPTRYRRVQILLRIGLWVIISWLGNMGLSALYVLAPIISAALIGQRGGASFLERYEGRYRKALGFWMGLNAFLWYATDSIPTWGEDGPSRFAVRTTGTPTVGSALLRLILVIPHVIVLGLLSVPAVIFAVLAFVTVLVNESVPGWVCNYQGAFLAWQARTLAYFVSLVEEYPPFAFGSLFSAPAKAA